MTPNDDTGRAQNERRFARQARFAQIGSSGQARIQSARVLVVGCGALGGVIAQTLTRSGVGELVLVDRDIVELSNLPRQVLFNDDDAREGRLKVEAAERTLAGIGGPTRFECHAEHLDAGNLPRLAHGCDLIVDGTDNMGTRYLVNDYAVQQNVPWIYGGVVGGGGLCMPILPTRGACLRCVFRDPPPPGTLPTCETAGVVLPAVAAVAALQSGLALRLLVEPDKLESVLIEIDVWNGDTRRLKVSRDPNCPCCGGAEFEWLHAPSGDRTVVLCGRDTVQVTGRGEAPDMEALVRQLEGVATEIQRRGPLLRFALDNKRVTLFADGRALIEGTSEAGAALALYERFISS